MCSAICVHAAAPVLPALMPGAIVLSPIQSAAAMNCQPCRSDAGFMVTREDRIFQKVFTRNRKIYR